MSKVVPEVPKPILVFLNSFFLSAVLIEYFFLPCVPDC